MKYVTSLIASALALACLASVPFANQTCGTTSGVKQTGGPQCFEGTGSTQAEAQAAANSGLDAHLFGIQGEACAYCEVAQCAPSIRGRPSGYFQSEWIDEDGEYHVLKCYWGAYQLVCAPC